MGGRWEEEGGAGGGRGGGGGEEEEAEEGREDGRRDGRRGDGGSSAGDVFAQEFGMNHATICRRRVSLCYSIVVVVGVTILWGRGGG